MFSLSPSNSHLGTASPFGPGGAKEGDPMHRTAEVPAFLTDTASQSLHSLQALPLCCPGDGTATLSLPQPKQEESVGGFHRGLGTCPEKWPPSQCGPVKHVHERVPGHPSAHRPHRAHSPGKAGSGMGTERKRLMVVQDTAFLSHAHSDFCVCSVLVLSGDQESCRASEQRGRRFYIDLHTTRLPACAPAILSIRLQCRGL